MNIWIMMWIFLAVFIVGTFLWTLQILLRQKSAWEQFAKRHNLQFARNAFLKSPSIQGTMRDFYITLSSSEVAEGGQGAKKFRTVLQFNLKPGFATEGVVASPGFRSFANGLDIPKEFLPVASDWNRDILIKCQDPTALTSYFTPERVQAINALFSIKSGNSILIFDVGETFFRYETPDPLDDVTRLEKLVSKILDVAKILEVK